MNSMLRTRYHALSVPTIRSCEVSHDLLVILWEFLNAYSNNRMETTRKFRVEMDGWMDEERPRTYPDKSFRPHVNQKVSIWFQANV